MSMCFINELLGVFLHFGPVESRGIHLCEIPQTRGHGANMYVSSGYHLLISLGRYGLCLSVDVLCLCSKGVGHLEIGCFYVPIYQRRMVYQSFIIISNFFKRRDLITSGRNSRIGNLFIKSLSGCSSYIHCL